MLAPPLPFSKPSKVLQRRTWEYAHRDGQRAEDDFLSAEQNARLVRNAEEYYRAMFRGRVNTWNLGDRHMAETLDRLAGTPGSALRPRKDRGVGAQLASG